MLQTFDALPAVADAAELEVCFECVREWRTQVSSCIEQARSAGQISCPDVELTVTLTAAEPDYTTLASLAPADLASVLIVSSAEVKKGPIAVAVQQSKLAKCSRCWRRDTGVGEGEHPAICARCEQALAGSADDERQI